MVDGVQLLDRPRIRITCCLLDENYNRHWYALIVPASHLLFYSAGTTTRRSGTGATCPYHDHVHSNGVVDRSKYAPYYNKMSDDEDPSSVLAVTRAQRHYSLDVLPPYDIDSRLRSKPTGTSTWHALQFTHAVLLYGARRIMLLRFASSRQCACSHSSHISVDQIIRII